MSVCVCGFMAATLRFQVHFRTANPIQMTFSSSSAVLNRVQYGAITGQGSNMMSVPTDCDQRDERLGYVLSVCVFVASVSAAVAGVVLMVVTT